jgi:tRNA pseudouridine38-40 synthase
MKKAATFFVREADFSSFSSNRFLHPVRTITRSEIRQRDSEIIYTVRANGFLRYMVRSIVGTLLEVGRGKTDPSQIEDLFTQKKRTPASPTSPPHGLCLLRVQY